MENNHIDFLHRSVQERRHLLSIGSLVKHLQHCVRQHSWFLLNLIALKRARTGAALRWDSERRIEARHILRVDSGIVEVLVGGGFSHCRHVPPVQGGLRTTGCVPTSVRDESFSQEFPSPSIDLSNNCAPEQGLRDVLFAE
eukprot:SAG31_NODE_287_length_18430_cov_8.127544_2_plen_141_part_00